MTPPITSPLDLVEADPWGALRSLVGGPLHPGGDDATVALLDRADVGPGTRVLDIGCGTGNGVALAAARGAEALGLDRRSTVQPAIRADLEALPIEASAVDVVVAECVLCLATDLDQAIDEAVRAIRPGGRLAMSDLVVDGDLPDLPPPVGRVLCLDGTRDRTALLDALERAGLAVGPVVDHREALIEMRDRAADRVDYVGLLRAAGERGRELLEAVESVEAAIETGDLSYVSVVARLPGI